MLQRRKHVSSIQELELSGLLEVLQQPQSSSLDPRLHPINTLHSINEARKLPGCTTRPQADQLRMRSVKVLEVSLLNSKMCEVTWFFASKQCHDSSSNPYACGSSMPSRMLQTTNIPASIFWACREDRP